MDECQNAFEYLKTQLMKPTILQYPGFNNEFCIETDASKQACEAVLTQDYNNTQLLVAYASRAFTTFTKTQLNKN